MMLFSLSNIFSQQADLILALLIAILNMNLIEFNGEYFLQIEGLGMGTSLAPTLANIYVGCLEKQCRILLSTALILYLRYIDDILAIWDGDMASALLFIDQINYYLQRLLLFSIPYHIQTPISISYHSIFRF